MFDKMSQIIGSHKNEGPDYRTDPTRQSMDAHVLNNVGSVQQLDNYDDMNDMDYRNEERDLVESLNNPYHQGDKFTSVSQLKPNPYSAVGSNVSGRTYISELQKQLVGERQARKKLETDLDDLKKISSEITSQLSAIQKQQVGVQRGVKF